MYGIFFAARAKPCYNGGIMNGGGDCNTHRTTIGGKVHTLLGRNITFFEPQPQREAVPYKTHDTGERVDL